MAWTRRCVLHFDACGGWNAGGGSAGLGVRAAWTESPCVGFSARPRCSTVSVQKQCGLARKEQALLSAQAFRDRAELPTCIRVPIEKTTQVSPFTGFLGGCATCFNGSTVQVSASKIPRLSPGPWSAGDHGATAASEPKVLGSARGAGAGSFRARAGNNQRRPCVRALRRSHGRLPRTTKEFAGGPLAESHGLGRTRRLGWSCWLMLAASLLVAGCRPAQSPARTLELQDFFQAGERAVLLNETLVFHFTAEVDPTSLTAESLRIIAPDGEPARGRAECSRNQILFHPDIPRRRDLTDGGLLPGTRYRVELRGFPEPDGLRGRGGEPLMRSRRFHFTTVEASEEGLLFADLTPELARLMRVERVRIEPIEAIALEIDEPVDPRSLNSADFVLRRSTPQGVGEPLSLRAELVRNDVDGARVELRALAAEGNLRSIAEGEYHLGVDLNTFGLCDLHGNRVLPEWNFKPERVERISVESGVVRVREGWLREDFLDTARRSPVVVEGATGTAHWESTGSVGIRFPAAAGDGRDGAVELGGDEERTEIAATELLLSEGQRCKLTSQPKLVVLASQGSMVIDGVLWRSLEGLIPDLEQLEPVSDWFQKVRLDKRKWTQPAMEFEGANSLSDWLKMARSLDPGWTVLIAGGDLVIRGDILIDAPLLMVAGGRIRSSGGVKSVGTFLLGGGGGAAGMVPRSPNNLQAPLWIDPPDHNPLRQKQTWAIRSAPMRPPGGVQRWLPARVGARMGSGSLRVAFTGERDLPSGGIDELGPVDDPVLLGPCEAVRLLIELEMPPGSPGEPWDPPSVDFIELAWDQDDS